MAPVTALRSRYTAKVPLRGMAFEPLAEALRFGSLDPRDRLNTREDAERFAVEAVEDAIESGADEISGDAEVLTLDVRIAKAS